MLFYTGYWVDLPPEHLAVMEDARPGSSINANAFENTVTLSRIYEHPRMLEDKSVRNVVLLANPLSKMCTTSLPYNTKIIERGKIPVFIDGACKRNGQPNAKAGIGIFFGPQSPYNISERISSGPQTNQRAEILAAIRAVKDFEKITENDFSTNMLVLITDSSYLVQAMNDWVHKWKKNGWKTSKGGPVVNRADFEELDEALDYMQYEVGIEVKFWLVKREENAHADALASAACT